MTTVCIDGWNLALPKGSGIATYSRNLLTNLHSLGLDTQVLHGPAIARSSTDFMNEVALMDAGAPKRVKSGMRRSISTALSGFGISAYPVRMTGQVIWPSDGMRHSDVDQLWASTDLFNLANRAFRTYRTFTPVNFQAERGSTAPDVMHWTCPLPLRARNAVNIYTFHDLIPLKLPHTTLDDKRAFYDQCMKIVKRADHLVTVSETTRRDVIKMLGADPNRVTNTYQAVNPDGAGSGRTDQDVATELGALFDLEWKQYFLFFGAVEPKKNLARLIEAYLAARTKTPLVIVAGRAWLAESETALLNEVLNQDRKTGIRRLEYLPSSLLKSLVRGAKATLFPSLYEGFGLPVLESMMVGTAVLTSTAGSLPEVAGDAALMVDPSSVDSIRQGLATLDSDSALVRDLETRGRRQAGLFTPKAYQDRLMTAYKAAGVV